jgi:hypothetical protein
MGVALKGNDTSKVPKMHARKCVLCYLSGVNYVFKLLVDALYIVLYYSNKALHQYIFGQILATPLTITLECASWLPSSQITTKKRRILTELIFSSPGSR